MPSPRGRSALAAETASKTNLLCWCKCRTRVVVVLLLHDLASFYPKAIHDAECARRVTDQSDVGSTANPVSFNAMPDHFDLTQVGEQWVQESQNVDSAYDGDLRSSVGIERSSKRSVLSVGHG